MKPKSRFVWLLVPLLCVACTRGASPENVPALREYSSKDPVANVLGCKSMVDSYCDYLYSPDAMGNVRITSGTHSIDVLQGHTPNDFTAAYYEYARAILHNRRYLPKDFRNNLQSMNYFDQLSGFLSRKPRSTMSLGERGSDIRTAGELSSAWSTSMENTVMERMAKRYPGFHNIAEPMIPIEHRMESRRTRRQLRSEIYQAVWRQHPNWLKVESAFENLRLHYLQMIADLKLPDAIRTSWTERIKSVRLVLPGSIPEIADDECSETAINAYYYTTLNVITVCAGDFNSEDIYQTLAHELSHAIDVDRSFYLYQKNSSIGLALDSLRGDVCSPEQFSCGNWFKFKREYEGRLASLRNFTPMLPEFQRCLKPRATSRILDNDTTAHFARQIVVNRIADLAESDLFLRITKPKIPMPNGTSAKNPNYFNPCSYYLWSHGEEPIDDDLSALIFFTAEYRCSSEPDPGQRLKTAINTSQEMLLRMEEEVVRMEGEFSSDKMLQAEGYSASPSERFADVVGSEALAYLLQDMPDPKARQNLFLASSSWQCKKPSLAKYFPDESRAQHLFTLNSHTENEERRKELIPASIRLALGCQKDFEFPECNLPKLPHLGPTEDLAGCSAFEKVAAIY
jgi:hypothetical protein